MNYLMIGLARAAGFQATELRVTARNASFFLSNVRDATQLNADVVWVQAGGKEYFLDPAAAKYPFGVLPWFETAQKEFVSARTAGRW